MAKKKSSQSWLIIVLAAVLLYAVYDTFLTDLNLSDTKKIFDPDKKKKVEFDLQNFNKHKLEFHKYKIVALSSEVSTNPFYVPVKKTKKVYKPLLVVDIDEIYDGDTPYAEIGGELYTIGDNVKGWKIIEVQAERVRFEKGHNKVYIAKKPKKQQ